jgi:hypothetical protein
MEALEDEGGFVKFAVEEVVEGRVKQERLEIFV